jgi:hypothetical protein
MQEITSKEMYNEALKLFNVEIKKSGRGHIVLVTDGEGNPIRYPIRLSKFKERPGFYQAQKEQLRNKQTKEQEYHNQQQRVAVSSPSLARNLLKMTPREYSNIQWKQSKIHG